METDIYAMSVAGWAVAFICATVVGMSKAGLPGLGAFAVLLMAMVFPPKLSTGILLPVLIAGDALGACHFRRHADWRILFRLLPMALVGVFLGYLLMDQEWVDDNFIRISIGILILALLGLKFVLGKVNLDCLETLKPWQMMTLAAFFGILAGITTLMANAAGPIMLIYLLVMRLPKDVFIGTSAWFFMIINWIKVPFMVNLGLVNWDSCLFNLKLLPFIVLGSFIGIRISSRMSNKGFVKWVVILTVLAALKLLWN